MTPISILSSLNQRTQYERSYGPEPLAVQTTHAVDSAQLRLSRHLMPLEHILFLHDTILWMAAPCDGSRSISTQRAAMLLLDVETVIMLSKPNDNFVGRSVKLEKRNGRGAICSLQSTAFTNLTPQLLDHNSRRQPSDHYS